MSFSPNNSRKLFILFNVLSVSYTNRIQALNNCLTWAEQVKSVELQCSPSTLSYTIVSERMNATTNKVPVVETIYIPYTINIYILQGQITSVIGQATLAIYTAKEQSIVVNNIVTSQGLESVVFSYAIN